MNPKPLSSWPAFSSEEADAIAAVLESNRVNYWTGEQTRVFERDFATWAGTSFGVALANGTLALDLALSALDVGPGDEVIVTPRSFIASVSSVVNAGAVPIFADVDRDSGNISPATIAPMMTARTRAILPVHLAGWPCDMDGIMALAQSAGVRVIEDCAQAHGARIGERSVGSFGDVGAWSFCQDKIMTTGGEGGMVTAGDRDLWSRMWSLKDHGKSWEAVYERTHPPGFRWVHDSFGTNWRMMEIQAAIGLIQLRRMPEWTARRTAVAMKLAETLAGFPDAVRVPQPDAGMTHAYYRLYAYIRPEGLQKDWNRDRIIAAITARGAPVYHGTCPEIYLEKAFDGTPWRPSKRRPVARELGDSSMMFLTHPTYRDDEVAAICATISAVFAEAAA
jgi:dTDP-4-amino-4,6-dideoxygalactose transaminase